MPGNVERISEITKTKKRLTAAPIAIEQRIYIIRSQRVNLTGVLNSHRAIEAGLFVIRVFVRKREILSEYGEFARKPSGLENRVAGHDREIGKLIKAIKKFIYAQEKTKRQIGF